jgi:hypothetical protein
MAEEIGRWVCSRLLTPEDFRYKSNYYAVLKDGVWTVKCVEDPAFLVPASDEVVIKIRQKNGAVISYDDPSV